MRVIGLLTLFCFLFFGNVHAQTDIKKEDKKEKKESKKTSKKEEKKQSFGELAEEAGKRIWTNVKGFLNVVAEDLVDKKDQFGKKTEKPKEKEKLPRKKEKESSSKDEKSRQNYPRNFRT